MFRNIIILVFLVAAAGLVLSWVRRPKRLFEVRVGEDDVLVLGPIPNRSQAEVRAFVQELRLPVGARIVGTERGTAYRLEFSPTVRQDDRDRVREFIGG
ncbi:MAG: hypothetical protein CVU56_16025 [Deltaproteobacteria bacterium HGW-Deltaproteobacteria-14]|jgi:hypothetical protein|nr:MAG: hypothetical protein CVU56_16025 [Deltaproteobacteria bacterium HGW-Deltaproteobacteria-14]